MLLFETLGREKSLIEGEYETNQAGITHACERVATNLAETQVGTHLLTNDTAEMIHGPA